MKVYHLPTELATMPCQPSDIRFRFDYVIPNTLGSMETEEAAARIISFSKKLNEWTGVSWNQLVAMMKAEYQEHKKLDKATEAHNAAMEVWFSQLNKHFWLCVLTLGIYALFVRKPQRVRVQQPEVNLPFSGIFAFGPQLVINGIQQLLEKDYLKKESNEAEGTDILYPTPKLIGFLLSCQG
ncbi:MAG: hypothetical protein EXS48_02610 [Candidatus Staskawiczbacteria bacterium]|nr:hypothetical protein [Candidatus Staskawiczbacteria bacterium]